MLCPFCEKDDDRVVDSRGIEGGRSIRRRRECHKCGKRYSTYERIDQSARLAVVKRDGSRVPFDANKVLQGLQAACGKRPIPEDQKIAIVREVEEELRRLFEREVPSGEIGRLVAQHLRTIDKIAYIRFASEYLDFQNIDELSEEVTRLQDEPPSIADQTDLFNT